MSKPWLLLPVQLPSDSCCRPVPSCPASVKAADGVRTKTGPAYASVGMHWRSALQCHQHNAALKADHASPCTFNHRKRPTVLFWILFFGKHVLTYYEFYRVKTRRFCVMQKDAKTMLDDPTFRFMAQHLSVFERAVWAWWPRPRRNQSLLVCPPPSLENWIYAIPEPFMAIKSRKSIITCSTAWNLCVQTHMYTRPWQKDNTPWDTMSSKGQARLRGAKLQVHSEHRGLVHSCYIEPQLAHDMNNGSPFPTISNLAGPYQSITQPNL